MKFVFRRAVLCFVWPLMAATGATAAVSADEAKALGDTLTPWGAERAGNKEGTIPEYSGQIKIPSGYDPKKPGVRPDPFASEKPVVVITAQNMDRYADKLSEGVKAALKKYPAFRVDVYPSHRISTYPKYAIDNSVKNATSCNALDSGLRLSGCYAGVPFPIPKTGNEVMWNHLLTFTSYSWYGNFTSWAITANGQALLQGVNESYQDSPYYNPKRVEVNDPKLFYWRIRADVTGPARVVGSNLLVLDPLDAINVGRKAWQYIPGQRRVKLAPDLSYDTPSPQSGGTQTMDDVKGFIGAQDRFNFKLIGKRELYIPYNTYKFSNGTTCPNSVKFTKNHINADCMRWELHRVWVVEATLKPTFRHIYRKRVFYWDEDTAGAGLVDDFDASGGIYRMTYNAPVPFYESNGVTTDVCITYDLQTGAYAVIGDAAETGGWYPISSGFKSDTYYSPEALAGDGIR